MGLSQFLVTKLAVPSAIALCMGLHVISCPLFAASQSILDDGISLLGEYVDTQDEGGLAGFSFISLGDINQDGFDDGLVSAPGNHDQPYQQAGKAYVLLGNPTVEDNFNISLATQSFVGNTAFSLLGEVMSAGDSDGDGLADIVFGLYGSNSVYLFYGKNFPTWGIDTPLTSADTTISTSSEKSFGKSVSLTGDLNGDGLNELVIGAPNSPIDDTILRGQVFLYYGTREPSNSLTESNASAIFNGTHTGDNAGYHVDIVPDINGDGLDELLIGSHSNISTDRAGKVYLFYGSTTQRTGTISLSDADAIIDGTRQEDLFGSYVQGLGDINGDGFGEFMIGAPGKGTGSEGALYLYYGSATPIPSHVADTSAAIFTGTSTNEAIGERGVYSVEDINADGIRDILIGSYGFDNSKGQIYVLFGQSTPYTGTQSLTEAPLTYTGITAGDQLGYAVISGIDYNQDHQEDFVVGLPQDDTVENNVGKVILHHGTQNPAPTGLSAPLFLSHLETTTPLTTATNFDTVYVSLSGTDTDPTRKNHQAVEIVSTSRTMPVRLYLTETSQNSGEFVGKFTLVRSRHSASIAQVSAEIGNTVTLSHLTTPGLTTTLQISNAIPTVSIDAVVQDGLGENTKMRIDFTAFDSDAQTLSFTQVAACQFKQAGDTDWTNAVLSGTTEDITSAHLGISHSTISPMYWNCGNLNSTYHFRIKPHDGISAGTDYIESTVFSIDNSAPPAPVLATPQSRWASQITVTGSAEANTFVDIYVNDIFSLSTTVNSSGVFSASPIQLDPNITPNITAIGRDIPGNLSPTSNSVSVSFADYHQTLNSGGASVTIGFPYDAISRDSDILFSLVSSENIAITQGQAPEFYHYLFGFDLDFVVSGVTTNFTTTPATVTLNLIESVTYPSALAIHYWTGTAWSTEGITITSQTEDRIVFTTTHFSTFSLAELDDPLAPDIDFIKLNGDYIVTNNYYPSSPIFTVTITDTDSGIASWSIQLLDSSDTIIVESAEADLTTDTVTITLTPNAPLSEGTYTVRVQSSDHGIHTGDLHSTRESPPFIINSSQFHFSAVHGPNPVTNPTTTPLTIAYNLSQAANVQIYIIDLSGKVVTKWAISDTDSGGQIGYHELTWNCLNSAGLAVPNGLYYGYIIAKTTQETRKTKLKIMVIR